MKLIDFETRERCVFEAPAPLSTMAEVAPLFCLQCTLTLSPICKSTITVLLKFVQVIEANNGHTFSKLCSVLSTFVLVVILILVEKEKIVVKFVMKIFDVKEYIPALGATNSSFAIL
jgi:hypothetical protein